jgi:hypothetical protein
MNDRIITRLFGALQAIYGHKWSSLVVDEDMLNGMIDVWGRTLVDIDPMRIKQVLDTLPNEYPNWPPTVGQFLQLCNVGQNKDLPEFKSLPKPEADPKIAEDAFNQLRAMGMIK